MSESHKTYIELIKMRDTIIDYLEKEKGINEDALEAYEDGPIADEATQIKVMRENERIKLRDRIYELRRHIEVIKRMYPTLINNEKKTNNKGR